MQHAEVRESGPAAQVFSAPQNPYPRQLLAAVPKGVAKPLADAQETVLQGDKVTVAFT